jgi:MFS family permease
MILAACYAVSFIWVLNNSALPILLPLIKAEFNLTYFQSGLISTASMVTYSAMQFPVGILADKLGRKTVIVTGTFWVAVSLILTGLSTTYDQFLLSLIIVGIGNGMHFIPISTLLADTFSAKDQGKALSISGSSMAVSRSSTAFFAIPLALAIGWRNIFYVFSSVGFVAGLIFWKIVRADAPVPRNAGPQTVARLAVIRAFFRPDLMKITAIAHLMGYTIALQVFLPLFLTQMYGMDAQTAALHSIIPSIAWGISGLLTGTLVDKLGRKTSIIGAALLLSISSVLVSTVNNYYLLIAALTAMGLSNGLSSPAILAYTANIVRDETQASEMGMMNTFWVLGGVIGPAASGVIADMTGLATSFLFFSLLPLAAMVIVIAWLQN